MRELSEDEISKIEATLIDGEVADIQTGSIKFVDGKLEFIVTSGEETAREAIRVMSNAGLNIRNDQDMDTSDAYWFGAEGAALQKVCFVITDPEGPLFIGGHDA